jgi:hypothetical protein
MYVCAPELEAAAPTVFMVWLRACQQAAIKYSVLVFTSARQSTKTSRHWECVTKYWSNIHWSVLC